jgi:hypothetical protein
MLKCVRHTPARVVVFMDDVDSNTKVGCSAMERQAWLSL